MRLREPRRMVEVVWLVPVANIRINEIAYYDGRLTMVRGER